METVKGDLIKLALQGNFDVIIHGCNCFCTMGAGIAKTIKAKFPSAYSADLATVKGDRSKLGTISFAEVELENGKLIINGYTQYDFSRTKIVVEYEAIREVFQKVKNQFSGLRIVYPAIGAGLAGGDWKVISKIIEKELEGENHTFVEFVP